MREVQKLPDVHKLQWYLLGRDMTIHTYRRMPLGPERETAVLEKRHTTVPFGQLTEQQMATGEGIQPPPDDPRGIWWLNGVIGSTTPCLQVDTPSRNLEPGDFVRTTGRVIWKNADDSVEDEREQDLDITDGRDGKPIIIRRKGNNANR